jgi:hypothetical protein
MEEVTTAMREAADSAELEKAPARDAVAEALATVAEEVRAAVSTSGEADRLARSAPAEELEKVPVDDPDYEEAQRERLRRLGRLLVKDPVVFGDDEEFVVDQSDPAWYAKCVGLRLDGSNVVATLEGATHFVGRDSIRVEISVPSGRASASVYKIGATYRISVSEDR